MKKATPHSFRLAPVLLSLGLLSLAHPALAADAPDAQLQAEFSKWAALQDSQEHRTRHIMVGSREAALAVLDELRGGAAFAEVAKRVSKDPGSAAKGGDLGWVRAGWMDPAFAAALRQAGTGLYPTPVSTAFGWHVLQVEAVRPVTMPTFEEWSQRRARQLAAAQPQPQQPSVPVPAWTQEQWELVFAAAQHTAGSSSYVYQVANTADAEQAQRWSRFGLLTVRGLRDTPARHLVDVAPELRFALQRLLQPNDVSAPVLRSLPDGRKQWSVIKLVRRGSAPRLVLDTRFRSDAAAWVAAGRLPAPEQLAGDTVARARVAYWRATDAAAIERVPAELSADVEFGDHGTPLLMAMLRTDMAAAQALLRRGANPNRCAHLDCPITFAAGMKDPKDSLAWVGWLLDQGAKPDTRDARAAATLSTALAAAAWHGHRDVAERLIAAGASVDGAPDVVTTPLEAATLKGDRAFAEWLISRGASVMPRPAVRGFGVSSLYTAASGSDDPALPAWAEQTMLKAAQARPEFRFELHFEQAGRRVVPDASGRVLLKPAPFKLVYRLPDGADSVQLGASLQAEWLDEVRAVDLRNAIHRPLASAALTNAGEAKSDYLVLTPPCPAGATLEAGCDGVHMSLGVDPSVRDDFHERRTQGGKAYVRAVSHVVEDKEDVPLARLDGKTLYIATAVPLELGGATGTRLVHPKLLAVKFAR